MVSVPCRMTKAVCGSAAAWARRSSTIACQDSGVAFEESMSGSSEVTDTERARGVPFSSELSHPSRSAPGTRPWGESTIPMVPPV